MGRLVYGRPAENGTDLTTGTTFYQPFKVNKDLILIGMRHWLIFYDNPVVGYLKCSLYADDFSSGVHLPSTKIIESTKVWRKSEIITEANGHFEIYYDFPEIPLQENSHYHFVFNADTYAPAGGAHLAVMLGYPDFVYQEGLTIAATTINVSPFALTLIGADF